MDAEDWGAHAQVGGGEGGEVDGFKFVEPAFGVQEADGVARDEAAERVAYHAKFLDVLPMSC